MMNDKEGQTPDNLSLASLASVVLEGWLADLPGVTAQRHPCPTMGQLDDYVAGRTNLVIGKDFLAHVGNCAVCCGRLAALRLMQSKDEGRTLWRLKHIRRLVGAGSARATEAASRSGQWLLSLAGSSADGVGEDHPDAKMCMLDGGVEDIACSLASRPCVDEHGRLALLMTVDVPASIRVSATVSLSGDKARLELFAIRAAGPTIAAVVDLSCCVRQPTLIPARKIVVTLRQQDSSRVEAVNLSSALEAGQSSPTDLLEEVDRLLRVADLGYLSTEVVMNELSVSADPGRVRAAIHNASGVLSRYVTMWRTGNDGEVPEAATAMLMDLQAELGEAESRANTNTMDYDVSGLRKPISHVWRRKRVDQG